MTKGWHVSAVPQQVVPVCHTKRLLHRPSSGHGMRAHSDPAAVLRIVTVVDLERHQPLGCHALGYRCRKEGQYDMPKQYSCQAKTTVDPKHVVVKDPAEKSYIVVHVCCVGDQSAQQECLYSVPPPTTLHCRRTTQEKCKASYCLKVQATKHQSEFWCPLRDV